MGVIVRSWNLFHGNADPPRRRGYLRKMVELVAADRPTVVCLQEVPVWALPRLDDWSGMRVAAAITRIPLWPGASGAWATRLHQGVFRSAFAGQANAILTSPEQEVDELGHERISERGRERRVVQCVRLAGIGVVANLHATNEFDDPGVPAAEVERAREFAESLARQGEPVVVAGDLNLHRPALAGYSAGGPGIDHVLVRGTAATPLVTWPRERRVQDGVVLSDHAPVELTIG